MRTSIWCPEAREVTTSAKPKTARSNFRVAPAALAIVQRAADLQGRSTSDFVATAAYERAQQVIRDAQLIALSVEDQRSFASSILNPPSPSPALVRAAAAYARLLPRES